MQDKMIRVATVVLCLAAILAVAPARGALAADPEVEELKRQVEVLMKRVQELEKARAVPPAAPSAPTPQVSEAEVPLATTTTPPSRVKSRGSLKDEQVAAPRIDDVPLDAQYKGFSRVPNTRVLIKFNAKPRVDATYDNQNSGDDNRFVTARIPVDGDPQEGGDPVFNINAKASQLRIDVRAPEVPGKPRFYYENDFYGSGGGEFPFRVRHLYGQFYNVIVGQTYSVFEDPDVWPDTVDYEGPNSATFARRPLIRYQHRFDDAWQLNLGIEQPDSEIDFDPATDPDASTRNEAPDGGFNVRWENEDIGHVQFATILRDIGIDGPVVGDQNVFGWGLNLSGGFNVFDTDSMQVQATYGEGIFRYVNDDFQNLDAAFDSGGDLEALPYLGLMFGYTHRWNSVWRSTVSYGYVNVDNSSGQDATAYHETHYASLNLVWQIREKLSVGLEELYGRKETNDGSDGDAWRTQLGLVYQIFD